MPIELVTSDDETAQSDNPVTGNIAALKELFPQAFGEGKIDFDTLRQLLGDAVDDGDERYSLNWSGKRAARRLALTPSAGTLRPLKEDSVEWDTTQNLMIEGDNLEVLKLLQKSYAGKVKMIYIDPPYNTGNDFVYPDNYKDSIGNYLRRTGQLDESGVKNSSNTESSGRFHTDWLNMIYPRLILAKQLLRKDGVIFVNIDDTELANLHRVLSEVFGEENFVANVLWQKKYAVSADEPGIAPMHDHIVVYRKSSEFVRGLLPRTEEQDKRYVNIDNDPRGRWASDNYVSNKSKDERPTLWYPIRHPNGGREIWPEPHAVWRYAREKHAELEHDNRLYWGPDLNYERPRMKRFLNEVQQGLVPSTWWTFNEVGHNDEAQKAVGELLGRKVFSTPKPLRLLDRILTISADKDAIVLDFFAGSGTTAHAVMAQNAVDGGNRRYILVQLPEPLSPDNKEQKSAADFCDSIGKPRTIAELTKERLRRAGAKIRDENLLFTGDTGFRTYKLSTSNIRAWNPSDDLAGDIEAHISNLLPDRSEDDLLAELLLKTGLDLTTPMQTRVLGNKNAQCFGGGALITCFADISEAEGESLADGLATWHAELAPETMTTMFFRDTGFASNQAKLNLSAILEQRIGDKRLRLRSL